MSLSSMRRILSILVLLLSIAWSRATLSCSEDAGDIQRKIQHDFFNFSAPRGDDDIPGPPVSSKTVTKLVFASCNHQSRPQPAWKHIANQSPDAFVWMGDIVYLDRHEVKSWTKIFEPPTEEKFREIYGMQQTQKDYCPLIRSKMPVLGVWDDHDMGRNDGDHTYPLKHYAQQRLLDFLDVPSTEEIEALATKNNLTTLERSWLGRRKQTGAYNSHVMGEPGKRVKVILLDNRFFQNEIPGDMLGDEQWRWLERELEEASAPYGTPEYDRGGAEIVFIATGIQVIGWGKIVGEGWRQFPASRSRLLTLLAKMTSPTIVSTRTPPAVMLFSGDVHFAEAARTFSCSIRDENKMRQCTSQEVYQVMQQSNVPVKGIALNTVASIIEGKSDDTKNSSKAKPAEIDLNNIEVTPVVEITTSGMTHAWGELMDAGFIFTPLTEFGFPILNRQHLTNFEYNQNVPGFGPWKNPLSLASSLVDTLSPSLGGKAPHNRDSQHTSEKPLGGNAPVLTDEDLYILKSQKSFYTKRNYATVDISWGDTGIKEAREAQLRKEGRSDEVVDSPDTSTSWVTVRIHSAVTGEPVMVYPLPFEALRSFSPKQVIPDNESEKPLPQGLIKEALNQCLKEAVERGTPPFVLSLAAIFRILVFLLLFTLISAIWIGLRIWSKIRSFITPTKRKQN